MKAPVKPRSRRLQHSWLFALPGGSLPPHVECNGRIYEHVETFKHDFFAATGLYRGPEGHVVLKLGRRNDLLTLPMAWLGAMLTRREARAYALLQDLPGIPRFVGVVGRSEGFLHAFVPGHPLGRDERVADSFFDELLSLLREVHRRDMAYVDLNKRQNILVGDDGRPYLIDFQISLHFPARGWSGIAPLRWLLARFQHGDHYHCLKHKRRLRPDLLTADERAVLERLGFWIRLHRWVSRPLTYMRRRTLNRLQRGAGEVAGSSAK